MKWLQVVGGGWNGLAGRPESKAQ
ncbi:uncharacterized protein G2W53_018627 [Senna tora]|uniref:Uncharacterized protein n=1 Tax=Senna tora TaxID=362788 RepID=A0A834WNI2_9FABA|nr:uncharacterized protein G2W53_018627 [Senna tora]